MVIIWNGVGEDIGIYSLLKDLCNHTFISSLLLGIPCGGVNIRTRRFGQYSLANNLFTLCCGGGGHMSLWGPWLWLWWVLDYVVVIIKAIGLGSNQINKRGIKHTLERMWKSLINPLENKLEHGLLCFGLTYECLRGGGWTDIHWPTCIEITD